MNPSMLWAAFRKRAASIVAFCCAAFTLCVLALLVNDAFFDINRFKVNSVYQTVPVMGVLMLLSLLLRGRHAQRVIVRCAVPSCLCMGLFALSCVLSCALGGFERPMLTGENGRYCGLWFTLCCVAAFYIICMGGLSGRWLMPMIALCSFLCAFLGVINAMGIDPLHFYARIKKGQEQTFLSTIGHYDFFGSFIVLMFALTAGFAVFESKRGVRRLYLLSAVVMAFGASASRTDSAFLALHLACFLLTALAGDSYAGLSRALLLWAVGFLSLPVTKALLAYSPYHPTYSGLPLALCQTHLASAASLLLTGASALCHRLDQRGCTAPGQKRMVRIVLSVLLLGAALLAGAIGYFTWAAPQADLGEAETILRFSDEWGTLRGFVYTRALRAFSDYSPVEKLFGRGMDMTLSILRPYFDRPEMLVGGVFNDAHCQPLQYLLTCGLLGMLSYCAFYAAMFILLQRRASTDPLLCGAFCAVTAYSVILLLNVTQPILIATYFSICALAVSRIIFLERKRRTSD